MIGAPIDHCLATYGSLAPGRANHHELAGLTGEWQAGTVTGRLFVKDRGVDRGYPAISLAPDGPAAAVDLFISPDLPAHWARLDEFEGEGYVRVAVTVATTAGPVEAWIYADSGIVAE